MLLKSRLRGTSCKSDLQNSENIPFLYMDALPVPVSEFSWDLYVSLN